MPLTQYSARLSLQHLLGKGVYISLHTTDPGEEGRYEVAEDAYTRQYGRFEARDGGMGLANTILFDELAERRYTHFGLWDTSAGGNLLWSGVLRDAEGIVGIRVKAGDAIRLKPGNLFVAIASREE